MRSSALARPRRRAQRGFGLLEILIGLLIGVIAVFAIFQVYAVSEGFRRNATAAGEAQQTGVFSVFLLGLELGNAGAGIAVASKELVSCDDPGGAMPMRFAHSFRPLPLVVADSGNDSIPDTFVVSYGMATTLASVARFTADAAPGTPFAIRSPGGFHPAHVDSKGVAVQPDLVVAISNPGSPVAGGPCTSSRVMDVSPSDGDGVVTLAQAPVDPVGGIGLGASAVLLNLGPCNRVQKIMYSLKSSAWDNKPVCNRGTPCVLYSTPLLDTQGDNCGKPASPLVGNPLASNIVNVKLQYGIDADGDPQHAVDTWVRASGDWSYDALMQGTAAASTISRIKAVRLGIIVQGEQFDQALGDYNWVLFDCPATDKKICPGRLTGTIARQTNPLGNWGFRKYETVIPLRNAIWNHFQP